MGFKACVKICETVLVSLKGESKYESEQVSKKAST